MKRLKVVLVNEEGLHARPALEVVEAAQKFASEIRLAKNGQSFSAKSMVGVLCLGGCRGDEIEILAEGEDEEAAVAVLGEVVCALA